MAEVLGLAHQLHRGAAQRAHDGAEPAAVYREHAAHHANQHHHGNKVGHVGGRLRDAAEALAGHIVHDQRQQDGEGEACGQVIQAQQQGVAHDYGKLIGLEEEIEPLHAHPFAARDAVGKAEIAEGNLHAVHGPVIKKCKEHQRRQNHDVQRLVLHDI